MLRPTLLAVACAALAVLPNGSRGDELPRELAGLVEVVDGDTLDLQGHRIRLFGIDAFESEQTCRWAESQEYPCGAVATAQMTLYTLGRAVSCTIRGRADGRGRRLVGVCAVEGEDLAARLVTDGWAIAWPRYSDAYVAATAAAAAGRAGAHGGRFLEPWKWRRR